MASFPYSGLSVRKRRPPDVHGRHAARHSRFSPMRIPSRTGATVAVVAALAQLQHAITQFVAHYPRRRWRGTATGAAAAGAQYCGATATHAPSPCCCAGDNDSPLAELGPRSDGSAGDPAHDRADCGPAPAAQYPANHPPVTPPRMAPPTGSCAAAFCIGAAMASESKAAAPNARYIVIRRAELEGTAIMERIMPIRSLLSECSFNTDQTEMIDHLGSILSCWLCEALGLDCPINAARPRRRGDRVRQPS